MDNNRFGVQRPEGQYHAGAPAQDGLSAEVTQVLRNTYMLLGM